MDQLVVGCIVDNSSNPSFVHTTLRAPGEVACVQPQGTVFLAAPPHADWVNGGGAILILAASVLAHIFASCGRAFSCPQSYSAWASCPKRCPWLDAAWKELGVVSQVLSLALGHITECNKDLCLHGAYMPRSPPVVVPKTPSIPSYLIICAT